MRTLDALVAERLIGWTWGEIEGERVLLGPITGDIQAVYWPNRLGGVTGLPWNMPSYSTDIAAAWTVLDSLENRGIHVGNLYRLHEKAWVCTLHNRALGKNNEWTGIGNTAMSAICRAALGTAGVTDEYISHSVWDNDKKDYQP